MGLGGCHCKSHMMREIKSERERETDTEVRGHHSKLCAIICHICPLQCATTVSNLFNITLLVRIKEQKARL